MSTDRIAPAPVGVRCVRQASAPDPLRVLLLHGLCSGADVWDAFVPLADPRCEIWAAELPWRGTGIKGWTTRPVEEWVDKAVEAVPGGPDVLVAHSFGTNCALTWLDRDATGTGGSSAAGARPLRGVVLVSPLYRAVPEDFDWETIAYYFNNFDRILVAGMQARLGRRLAEEHQQAIALKVRDFMGPYGWLRFFDTYLRMPAVRTERLEMPFLVVGGASDRVAFPSDAEALARTLPDASVRILPHTEHFPMVSSAKSFAEVTNAFLHDLPA
ncbi:alpha/beta fold hydrolase [Streptomyces abikoensis]|uniref:Alpha/beta fold hydrolase n=1 Tax=Streptomyces abikoensis TaxID=97398 RepID=A0ABW7SXA4_9ACTN